MGRAWAIGGSSVAYIPLPPEIEILRSVNYYILTQYVYPSPLQCLAKRLTKRLFVKRLFLEPLRGV